MLTSTKNFIHPGPLIIHLSKVPDGQNISENDGSGDWVKIYTMGLNITQDQPLSWLLMDKDPHVKVSPFTNCLQQLILCR